MSDQHDTEPISKMMRRQSGHVEINMPRSYFRSNLVVSLSTIRLKGSGPDEEHNLTKPHCPNRSPQYDFNLAASLR